MLTIGDKALTSRLLLGTALFPTLQTMTDAIIASQTQVVTVSIRRQMAQQNQNHFFWETIKSLDLRVLPNTAGCKSVKEAVTTAHVARELFGTHWIKLEVIGDDYTLSPDGVALVEAARMLVGEGFEVLPYTTEDLCLANRLIEAGCRIIMPWAAPIGSGQGPLNLFALRTLRERLKDVTLIVDAGLGKPSHAAQVLEMGFDGVLLNSAVALAQDPVSMAKAFSLAAQAGRLAFEAGVMPVREMASPSTPTLDMPMWHQGAQA
jgi:thiazole synthase